MAGGPRRVFTGPPPPPPPTQGRLAFLDGLEEQTSELTLLRLGFIRSLFLAELTTRLARRAARGRQATRADLRLLRQLVSSDFRHRVVARDLPPGSDDAVNATVTRFAPDGSVVDEVDVWRPGAVSVWTEPEARGPAAIHPAGLAAAGPAA